MKHADQMAVIGAGPVGLCVAKALQEQDPPVLYDQLEASDDVGGNWYRGVYKTAHIISSKKTTEYSDYPMPADYPDFPSRDQLLCYLRAYAERFDLRRFIQFNTRVERACPTPDQHWEIELAGGERRVYKGIIVCNGHHSEPRWPKWPQDAAKFAGEYIHSKCYKSPQQLADKRVLVIGGGNSACDIAAEAARVGRRCWRRRRFE